ncbi:MAG: penicillin acylase family protein [Deltaproteobacteria bacterium]|jgi:hypothetical protein|nr:penicillin acylase family protein [Deltaproteobacteria bacterium]
MKTFASASCVAVTILAAALLGFGCTTGPMEPGRLAATKDRAVWLELVSSVKVADKIFYVSDSGDVSPVFVSALPLSGELRAAADRRWAEDQRFQEQMARWTGRGRSTVLVGLYARGLNKDELIKSSRFKLTLRRGAQTAAPEQLELVDRAWVDDYFPGFNHWEKVLAASFKGELGPQDALTVEWPSGRRELALFAPSGPGAGL